MDPVIFLEKVRRPELRGLVRERLDRRTSPLTDGAPDPVSLGLVLGPPGSGKTTLLSHIAAAASEAAAWYRVGTEDDDEIALTRHIGHTLGAALGEPGVIAAAAPGRIADLVRTLDDPAIGSVQLIIDDLHEITGTPAERALESFLQLRPRKIRVILGSRRPPRLNTSRMLVSGELIQLDGEDLRFRSWEVEQLFRAVYAAPLSPEAAAALTRRTGGWAAGLQLFHLATAQLSRNERERAVNELGGRSRLIRSYLARNVLDGLDEDRRRFLLLTSTLGVLTGDICDALLDTSGSAAVLSELEREQLFTTSTDAGLTYHYHQVLQTHLEVVLVDEMGGGRPEISIREARNSSSRLGGPPLRSVRMPAPKTGPRSLGCSSPVRRRSPGTRRCGACSHFRALRLTIPVWCWPAPGGWHGMVRLRKRWPPSGRRKPCSMIRSSAGAAPSNAAQPPSGCRTRHFLRCPLPTRPVPIRCCFGCLSNSGSSPVRYAILRHPSGHWFVAWRSC